MKKIFFIFLSSPLFAFAQNLVPNPSFEQYDTCPSLQDQVHYAIGWNNFAGSPDYFNSCTFSPDFSVPYNWGGYQPAANGNAYCALGTFVPSWSNGREFIGAQLTTPLTVGIKYYVSFKVCLSISDQIQAYIATDKTGAMFSTVPYTWQNPAPLTNNPPVYTNTIITDTVNWTRIFGSFLSDSSYNYIVLGNFFDDINTDTITYIDTALSFAYYYIDEVCVSTDSLYTATYNTGIVENNEVSAFIIYPNPAHDYVFITNALIGETFNIKIYSPLGQELYQEKNISSEKHQIDISNFNTELLFVNIIYKNQNLYYKLLKL